MTIISKTIPLIFLLSLLSTTAGAAIDMDAAYKCTVSSSSNSSIPAGAKTTIPIHLKNLLIMKFDSGGGFNFYGKPIPFFDGIHDLVLALDANSIREVYGTVYVTDKQNGQITMDIMLLEAERRIVVTPGNDNNDQRFVFTNSNQYGLSCTSR